MKDDDNFVIGERYNIHYKGEKFQGSYTSPYIGSAKLTEIYDEVYRYYNFVEFKPPLDDLNEFDESQFFCEDILGVSIPPTKPLGRVFPM